MLGKTVLPFILSFSMLVSPLANVGISGNSGIHLVSEEVSATEDGVVTIKQDFDELSDWWGMTGTLVGNNNLTLSDAADGGKYLRVSSSSTSLYERTASKVFEDVPYMETATVAFDWYTTALTSNSQCGRIGVTLKSGNTEIISLYMGEYRGENDGSNRPYLYYSTQDIALSTGKTVEGVKLKGGTVHHVSISLDFVAGVAKVTLDDYKDCLEVAIHPMATKVDTFMLNMTATNKPSTYKIDMGVDNFELKYTESDGPANIIIYAVDIEDVSLTKDEYEQGYDHPPTATAHLTNGETVEVKIDEESWTSTPEFKEDVGGAYTWTADIIAPEDYDVLAGLKASYVMKYTVPAEQPDDENIETFQDESIGNWGMTGDLAGNVKVEDDGSYTANKYLHLYKEKASQKSAVKTFEDIPDLSEATISFDWYTMELTTDKSNGYAAIQLMSNGIEILSLYYSDIRSAGDTNTLQYSITGFDGRENTSASVKNGGKYKVEISFDFAAHTATVKLDGITIVDSVLIRENICKIDQLAFTGAGTVGGGSTFTWNMGLDNFSYVYTEGEVTLENNIFSLEVLPKVSVTREEYPNYKQPTTVKATLTDNTVIVVDIDPDSWTSDFDANKAGDYTWTAEIIAPDKHKNSRNLKVSYSMEYIIPVSEDHDYYNDFTFEKDVWEEIAWSKNMDSSSGTGVFGLSQAKDSENNAYLHATVTGNGDRGSRLDLNSSIIKGAEISFDWMPINVNDKSDGGQVMFLSTQNWHPYFTLRFDGDYNLIAYTENPLKACSTEQLPFEGSIGVGDPIKTGLGGKNKWFTVSLTFDYLAHTADLIITDKKNPEKPFTQTGIPIETEANGLRSMVIHMARNAEGASVTMGLDNIIMDFIPFSENEVVSILNPADVAISKAGYSGFEFPKTVTVVMGDNTQRELSVEGWTADPAFDPEVSGTGYYVWSTPLNFGSYDNPYKFDVATFKMHYSLLHYPTYVYNPNTLELEYGKEWDGQFPDEVNAHFSDGTTGKVKVGGWTPIREFDSKEEGIYVYGANIVPVEGEYEIVEDFLQPNENPDDPSAQRKDYVYDVYYRISYFENADNYNAYQRTMEYLDRGVYAVAKEDGGIFVSWRLLATEYGADIAFNVYRNGELVNETPIDNKTNYVDPAGRVGDSYTVVKIQDDILYESKPVVATVENYLSIPVQKPEPLPDKNENLCEEYTLNDASVADVDGDGEYEVIVKWYPSNAFDSGDTQHWAPSSPTIFDVYKMDGTALWRLNLGLEMPSGAHFNQIMFYDLDEDGKAELFVKTSDGSISYKPNAEGNFDMTDKSTIVSIIGKTDVKPGSNVNDNGHVNNNTNEYVTVFNGLTGEVIDSIDYVNVTGNFDDWGKTNDGGNRSARYNIAIAYLPKDKDDKNCTETIPAVLFNRGYYEKTTVAAYTLRDGKLTLEWNFVRNSNDPEAGKGNHNLATGDLDGDGFDELVLGSIAIDHDGTTLWVKDGKNGQDFLRHGDAIHLSAMNPDSDDLYVFVPQEEMSTATLNDSLSNAGTGARIGGVWFTKKDVGRAVAANITPTPGFEYWSAATGSGIYHFDGSIENTSKPVSMNFVLYWDGDLLSELGDGTDGAESAMTISKYNWNTKGVDILDTFNGTKLNNWTKNTPALTADLFGDWREEVMLRNEDSTELRIYMTTEETDYMIYTLMHDPVYRNAVASQNSSYNQPAHLGFYLGEDIANEVLAMNLPTPKIAYPNMTVDVEVISDKDKVEEKYEELLSSSKGEAIKEGIKHDTEHNTTGAVVSDAGELMAYMNAQVRREAGLGELSEDQAQALYMLVTIKVDGEEVPVTDAIFPADGVDVTIKYPEGTNKDKYDFVVIHMPILGDKAGTIAETFAKNTITKGKDGLVIHITSASPFAIAWQEQPTPPDDGNNNEPELVETLDSTVPKTGDHMDTMIMVAFAVLVFAVAGAGIMIARKRRSSKAEE